MVQLIIQVLQGYGLNEDMGTHMIRVLHSVLHGFTWLEQMEGFRMQLDLDKSFSILIGTFIRGINSMANKEHEYFQGENNK
ncbi:WHG domain-containing protein [Domibacillus sp. PGB-M46]|nr:WHG domain-containing protein [Domibacillus sp. PGB-M46]